MKFRPYSLLLASLFLIPVAGLQAGELEPGLAAILENAAPGDPVSALVCLDKQLDGYSLLQGMIHPVRLSAAKRHEALITALQEQSALSQRALIESLEAWMAQGRVTAFTPFWISNIIAVTGEPQVLREIALRLDVGLVVENRPIENIKPLSESPAAPSGRGIEPGIGGTNAPALWAMGIDGTGVIVCNIDTGVEGSHPALSARWRGNDPGVSVQEAWFDPVTHTNFPQDFNGHGTHTMGTICGYDGGSNQVGMAPGAKWVAAATIDRVDIPTTMVDALASFQWCADPDGNPGTYDDVPAVTSNSWGLSPIFHSSYTYAGDPYFWSAIDNCEAAGCTVVFAAGNEGYYGSESIRTPSDRISSPVNVFSVGALESDQVSRADFSSMGPSGVDHYTKKPEVCAQGAYVRSSTIGGGYGYKDGTSMACPHVAGAVALLKQAYPDATPFEIKKALLMTAVDLGSAGNDNEYGMGRIDCLAAYNHLGQGQTLTTDTDELSLASKQITILFGLHAGAAYSGRAYLMLGSFSGSNPGTPLPGGLVLPINWDLLTDKILALLNLQVFMNFYGVLDAGGNGQASIELRRPLKSSNIGKTMTYAYCILPSPGFDFVSEVVEIDIVQ